jgi:hypothetical protein
LTDDAFTTPLGVLLLPILPSYKSSVEKASRTTKAAVATTSVSDSESSTAAADKAKEAYTFARLSKHYKNNGVFNSIINLGRGCFDGQTLYVDRVNLKHKGEAVLKSKVNSCSLVR